MKKLLLVILDEVNKQTKRAYRTSKMALSRFEYVKHFEHDQKLLNNCWIVVRVDGKGFHRFCQAHNFKKPNDIDALQLMNFASMTVMQEFNEIVLAYGQSDEYSFVFRRDASVYQRRRDKLVSYVASLFTSAYMFHWPRIFLDRSLAISYPPAFDARAVLYPTDKNLRDYLSWRQADAHVNNLYNTTFWNLVGSGMSNTDAENKLKGTLAKDKNEILFTQFNINYNKEPAMFRKGTILMQKTIKVGEKKQKFIVPIFEDLIGDDFWLRHPEILGKKTSQEDIYDLEENANQPIIQYQQEVHEKRK